MMKAACLAILAVTAKSAPIAQRTWRTLAAAEKTTCASFSLFLFPPATCFPR
jgi:hypothetical protein